MIEWKIVEVIATLIALYFTVARPMMKNNTTQTELNASLRELNGTIEKLNQDFKEDKEKLASTRKEMFDIRDKHDTKINDHELRIKILEHDKEKKINN
jgi:predicted  nucleic acid-binding Zn-ribbon protein